MKTPVGQGIWTAFPSMLGLSPKALATVFYLSGFDWVAPRGADGAYVDKNWTAEHTRACNDVGVGVYRWVFSRPSSWQQEVDIAARFKDEGDAGFIIDAEMPWQAPGLFDIASKYCDALDSKLGPDYFIADAPWPYVSYHWALDVHGKPVSGFPFHSFAGRMNARMPQSYWTEISGQGAQYHLPRIDAEWQKFDERFPDLARPVWPIGITYGKAEMKRWGSQQLPPGEITPEDVAFFDARYARGVRSYYSREAASEAVVQKLAELCVRTHEVQPTFDGLATMFGAETRAEWDADETARNDSIVTRHDAPAAPPETPAELVALSDRLHSLPPEKRREVLAFCTRKVGAHPAV